MLLLTARRNHRTEGIGILAVVMPEAELIQIKREIILRDVVIAADDSALQQGPETLDIVSVDLSANILAFAVVHDIVREAYRVQMRVTGPFVSRHKVNLAAHGLANEAIRIGRRRY